MEIAKYTVGVDFNLKWKQLDKNLKLLEKKLAKFSAGKLAFSIDRFVVDQRKLNLALGNALDRASMTTAFSIDRFVIDQSSLTRQMTRAMRNAARAASAQADITPNVNGRGGISTRQAGVAGGVGGFTARAYMPLLALASGGYGLGAVNRRNQEVVAAQLQAQAVSQAFGGTAEQGSANFDYLRKLADRVGFDYLQASPDFSNLMSNILGAGGTQAEGRDIFKGFSEYGRVNKLSAPRMNLVFNALSQVAGKDKLQAEELTKQLGNSLPGAKDIFAQAYQRQLRETGRGRGDLTGSAAIIALEQDMKKGLVRGDILRYAAQLAEEKAAPGLSAAAKASQAEQSRFRNAYNDLAILASDSGVESGFARLFRSMADGAREAAPLVKSLASGFDEVTKYVSTAMLSFQSIQRFFQGRDSFLGDMLFPNKDDREAAFAFVERLKGVYSEMGGILGKVADGWKMIFAAIDWGSLLNGLGSVMTLLQNLFAALNAAISGDYSGAWSNLRSAASIATAPGKAVFNEANKAGVSLLAKLDPRVDDEYTTGNVFQTGRVKSQLDYETEQITQRKIAAAQARKDGYQEPTGIFPMGANGPVTATFNIYDATNPEEVGQVVNRHLNDLFNSTKLEYSQKE